MKINREFSKIVNFDHADCKHKEYGFYLDVREKTMIAWSSYMTIRIPVTFEDEEHVGVSESLGSAVIIDARCIKQAFGKNGSYASKEIILTTDGCYVDESPRVLYPYLDISRFPAGMKNYYAKSKGEGSYVRICINGNKLKEISDIIGNKGAVNLYFYVNDVGRVEGVFKLNNNYNPCVEAILAPGGD